MSQGRSSPCECNQPGQQVWQPLVAVVDIEGREFHGDGESSAAIRNTFLAGTLELIVVSVTCWLQQVRPIAHPIFLKDNPYKEIDMNRLLICTTVGLFLGLTPALALDETTTVPGADTSSGAAQQSSSPPGSKSAMDNDAVDSSAATNPPEGSMDKSSGAAQQSSAPPSSSAANPSNPNPANSSAQ